MPSEETINAPYPVYSAYPPNALVNSNSTLTSVKFSSKARLIDDARHISRTPSPTPSEFNLLNGIKEKKSTKEKIQYYAILVVLILAAILISVFNNKIISGLKPFTDWMRDHKIGPLIPIGILIILSFPPLFGHEIVAMLAGVTWSLPAAFAIVAVGTLLGEIANFFVFKYACTARGNKMEAKDLSYGLLAHIVRNGGFLVVLVIRYSAIPPHFATVVFSTVGITFWVFLAAAVLSLPKQFIPVYVGYALKPENSGNTTSEKVEKVVLVLSIGVTIAALIWIRRKMAAAKVDFVYARRKARQGKVTSSSGPHFIGMPNMV
ncbi:hypothetical protein B0H10DRAFT_1938399 [Mycena sp. CBHHK59/15]|nr:hypothetical protein B0H10DRAFT_1938399 [Mycena sp. CBHHK59/15]